MLDSEEKLNINVIGSAFTDVINSYVWFLRVICGRIVNNRTDDLNRETRKFNAVKKELSEFLFKHRKFYKFNTVTVITKDDKIFGLDVTFLAYSHNTLKMEDIAKLDEELKKHQGAGLYYVTDKVEAEIIKSLKYKLGKSVITNEDISKFLENHFLVDKEDIGTKFSNYKELEAYIDSRVGSYRGKNVSTGHIVNISFKFQGSIKDFENEKSCCVCLKDYEEDQEVCRLPCNHFCCRNCTEQMFAVPQNGSKAYFQCPICRADCT